MGLQFQIEVPLPPQKKYTSNYISTTKYNIITFLPLSLLLQFKRYANIYFLICAILQSIPIISPLDPFSAIAPLVFVLALSMCREGYEDYKRYKSDQENNSSISSCYNDNNLQNIQWKDIKQGSLIRIQCNQTFPADMIMIYGCNNSGISYVQTSSLDGQKNLKPKIALAQTQLNYNKTSKLPNFSTMTAKINCTSPSPKVESLEGNIEIKLDETTYKSAITYKNMFLRGSKLRNTDWIIALTIYTGQDTVIMMNGCKPFTKTSNIQAKINYIVLVILLFQICCCLVSAMFCFYGCSIYNGFEQIVYNSNNNNCAQIAGIAFGSYFILYSTFIPISLIVSLEFVKLFQGYFMSNDKEMECAGNDRKLECHTVSINQELGQIQYILTDKTGTLTCNKMEFKNVIIGQQVYGQDISLADINSQFDFSRLSKKYEKKDEDRYSYFDNKQLTFELSQSQGTIKSKEKKKNIQLMFFIIATCHQCLRNGDQYQGPSPDEVALLKAAKNTGFQFISTQNQIMTISYEGKNHTYQVLKIIDFDSHRKRMSIILKKDQSILVYTKGADSSIQPILRSNQINLPFVKEKTNQMTKTGLRSLWFAYKILPLNTKIQELTNQEIQSDLNLVGATGIEDRLQDYVPQTIYSLRKGGIKFVMLTGDKLQTAENIARSCKMIEESILISDSDKLFECVNYIKTHQNLSIPTRKSPVIDGSAIDFHKYQAQLLQIIPHVKSMVFCRVTPSQKAQIVKLVKKLDKLTLAIGDGANDVNMIMEAHVGIGIFGQEGTRAAQVSNYAIGQFCLLWKLLLYYGRLNYMRITQMILYFFYKNMVFTIVQFAYAFYNLGSGQSFWLSWSITFYNMVFTCFPVVIRAVFEVDLDIKTGKKTFKQVSQGIHQNQTLHDNYPKMYFISQNNQLFTNFIFLSWFMLGILQGVICLMITLYTIGDPTNTSGFNSLESGLYFAQISAYTSVVIVVTIKLAINVKQWNFILVLGFLIPSIGAYIGYMVLTDQIHSSIIYQSTTDLIQMPSFYLAQILCIMGMFSFDFFLFSLEAFRNNFQNYLKFKTLRNHRLSQTNIDFLLEMQTTQQRSIQLQNNKKTNLCIDLNQQLRS